MANANSVFKTAERIMKILHKEDHSIAMVIITLCLAWHAGAETDAPFDVIDKAIDDAATATKHYARIARNTVENNA